MVQDRIDSALDDLKNRVSSVRQRFGQTTETDELDWSIDETSRDRDFQDDAEIVSEAIIEQFSPDSVFEIGCGIGLHLKPFLDAGITARGVDESDVAHENAVINTSHVQIANFESGYRPDQVYDLVLCIDLFEYTSRQREDVLMQLIADIGDIAVVSVPLPRFSHVQYDREEPLDYWVEKFAEYGLTFESEQTDTLQGRIEAVKEAWVPEQLLVFSKED